MPIWNVAPSEGSLLTGVLLVVLLALVLLAFAIPGVSILGVHPVSFLLVWVYVAGLRMVANAQSEPMWKPRTTTLTRQDTGEEKVAADQPLGPLALRFAVLAILVGGAGWTLAQSAFVIAQITGIGESVVGGVLTAVTTSLPELVVAIVAVRRGALALALGDILGGNAFDVLFLAAADAAYREGSIYAALSSADVFWAALSILLVGILLMGILRREQHGIGNIGFESAAILFAYFAGVAALMVTV
jgi:cation:H+ antiporter